MFSHILLPLDLAPRNERILAPAASLAKIGAARLTLLHVIERIEHLPQASLRSFYGRLERTARLALDRALGQLRRQGIDATAVVMTGAPAQDIVRFATRNRVDLIVMGSHRIDASGRGRGWGTTSYKVGLTCPCPVLLVK